MPKKTKAIEINTDARMYVKDARRCPLCNI